MRPPRPELVVSGQVVVAAGRRPVTAEAIGVAEGRVCAVGIRREVQEAAVPGARMVEAGRAAVVPGLHDFHLHLVGMARARREVRLDHAFGEALPAAVLNAAARLAPDAWVRGRGWHEDAMSEGIPRALARSVGGRPALIYSHDGHSAWASPAALAAAGIGRASADPEGGRIERDVGGQPTGVLRERAADRVEEVAGRLGGPDLAAALDEVLAELHSWGVTGATDAGDTIASNGLGEYAALGDRASLLLEARHRLDARLRLRVGLPAQALKAAHELGLRSLGLAPGCRTVRIGWAKVYADGALGSRTAALFEPYTCGDAEGAGDAGILRLSPGELKSVVADARRARIALAVHAIGDRAAASVLDALGASPERGAGVPDDRIEHLQLLRPADRSRLAAQGVTASVQPIHCPSDRDMVDACWSDRAALAYPWRALSDAGARMAFGSDAPIESANPWTGVFAAVRRRLPRDGRPEWHPEQALTAPEALAAYTRGPAAAARRREEGHLGLGAVADLAVLNIDLATLLAADERLAEVRSELTLVDGREVHRS